MKEKLLNMKFPRYYQEGLIEFKEGIDNTPSLIDFYKRGYSKEQYEKMSLLVVIEATKKILNEAIKENEITEEEITEAKKLIHERINEYNNIF